jgi:hypothetical protein
LDWFDLWPKADHLEPDEVPQSRPGTHVHGFVILASGDLVFNYENKGLLKVDPCGHVVWRVPYRTHHSVALADDGTFWVPGHTLHRQTTPGLYQPRYWPTVLQVSAEGKILREISIVDLLKNNGYPGLLYMLSEQGPLFTWSTVTGDDSLHLNSVAVFPGTMKAGAFAPGDVLVSLRNISTVLVFDSATLKIKFMEIGETVKQHDARFVDGDTLALFDNNSIVQDEAWIGDPSTASSRIVLVSAQTGKAKVWFEAPGFYNTMLGKQQWLPNGDVLVTAGLRGHAFEVNPEGRIVWEYLRVVPSGTTIMMQEVQRIPESVADTVVTRAAVQCRRQ